MGLTPLCGLIKKIFSKNLLVVGDAASQASPLFGEGIRYALHFGKLAGNIAYQAIKANNISESYLSIYQKKCEEMVKQQFKMITTEEVESDEFWDKFIVLLNFLKKKNKMRILFRLLRNEVTRDELVKIVSPSKKLLGKRVPFHLYY